MTSICSFVASYTSESLLNEYSTILNDYMNGKKPHVSSHCNVFYDDLIRAVPKDSCIYMDKKSNHVFREKCQECISKLKV